MARGREGDDERVDFHALMERNRETQEIVPRDKLPGWIRDRLPLSVKALKCSTIWLANV